MRKLKIYSLVLSLIIIVCLSLLGLILVWYSDHTIEGVCDQIRSFGFTVERADYNKVYESYTLPIQEIRYFQDFTYYANPYWSVSLHSYPTITVYWEPHYADSNPFYSIWFTDNKTLYVYTYFPEHGTGGN